MLDLEPIKVRWEHSLPSAKITMEVHALIDEVEKLRKALAEIIRFCGTCGGTSDDCLNCGPARALLGKGGREWLG